MVNTNIRYYKENKNTVNKGFNIQCSKGHEHSLFPLQKTNICYLAFPDSNSGTVVTEYFLESDFKCVVILLLCKLQRIVYNHVLKLTPYVGV